MHDKHITILKGREYYGRTEEAAAGTWIFVGLVVGIVAGLAFMVLPNGVSLAKT